MITEDRVNEYYRWVLGKIKELLLTTPTGRPLIYRLSHVSVAGVPSNDTEANILEKLAELGAIEILYENADAWITDGKSVFKLKVLQPKFDEIYKKYRELCNSERDTDDKTEISIPADTNNYKNIPINVLIADLTSKYHEIEKETNQIQFFIKTAHYGQYLLENETTVSILSPLYQEAKNDVKPYIRSCEKFIKEWEDYAKDLLEKAKIAGIVEDQNNSLDNDASRIMTGLNMIDKKGYGSMWDFDLDYYLTPYECLICQFNKIGKSDLLIPKHFDKGSQELKIYPFYRNVKDEWDKFKYSREAKVWWAHYQVCRLASGVLDLKERTNYFKDDNVIDGFYKVEFSQLARGLWNRTPIVLHSDKYKVWIKRLHEYLTPRIESLPTVSQQIETGFTDTALQQQKPSLPSKQELKKMMTNIIRTKKFGKKEKTFLNFLSKDFQPKTMDEISKEVSTRACKTLKARLQKKLKNTGFFIDTIKPDRWGGKTQYQLKYLTLSETS